jgi:hypothetical protein
MGEGNKFGRLGGVFDEEGMLVGWLDSTSRCNGRDGPEMGGGVTVASEKGFGAKANGDGCGCKQGFAAGIAELADGEQGLLGERREEMGNAGSRWEVR